MNDPYEQILQRIEKDVATQVRALAESCRAARESARSYAEGAERAIGLCEALISMLQKSDAVTPEAKEYLLDVQRQLGELRAYTQLAKAPSFPLPPAPDAAPPAKGTAAPRAEVRYRAVLDAQQSACRSCGAAIVWIVTTAGRRMPLSKASWRPDDQGGTYLSHFADCPNAADHRRHTGDKG